MINTEIFTHESVNNYDCFDDVLKMVNDFISENGIQKSDIIEYRTENHLQKNDKYFYSALISYWK